MTEKVTFDHIKGSIGSLIWLWVAIEHAARHEVASANGGNLPKGVRSIAGALNAWEAAILSDQQAKPFRAILAARLRAQLQRPLEIRNGVCHGLDGLMSESGDEPATMSWTLNGTHHSITWNELQSLFAWMSKVPFAIQMLSCDEIRPFGRLVDSPGNREWWEQEYGIECLQPR